MLLTPSNRATLHPISVRLPSRLPRTAAAPLLITMPPSPSVSCVLRVPPPPAHSLQGYASSVYKAFCKRSGELVCLKAYDMAALCELNRFQIYR